MSPLNDDELSSLLEQARSKPPEPSPGLPERALQSYRERAVARPTWRIVLQRPVSIPLPLLATAALLLVLAGAAIGFAYRRPPVIVESRKIDVPAPRERIVYRDCLSVPPDPRAPIASLTFNQFQPVREIKPRVVRSIRDDQ